jgi:error-prone DNA polymerase
MELAQAAPECGVRAIHGAEVDVIEEPAAADGAARPHPDGIADARHITLLVRDERGWRNLCRILTLAHEHTREGAGRRIAGEPAVRLCTVAEHAEGLVCLTGCATHGIRREDSARLLLDAFGPQNLYV